jgi:hypothetical protein
MLSAPAYFRIMMNQATDSSGDDLNHRPFDGLQFPFHHLTFKFPCDQEIEPFSPYDSQAETAMIISQLTLRSH